MRDDLSATVLATKDLSDASDWEGLHSQKTVNPPAGAGIQVDGYFPDDSTTNTTNGWNHDSQFVIRLPANWNGQLVVTGAPGVRKQYAPDYIISDWVLSQGYAYASTDKGNTGTSFFETVPLAPGQAVAGVGLPRHAADRAAKKVVAQRYGSAPAPHLDDRHLQRRRPHPLAAGEPPELYDGGVDWEGTLLTRDGPNLFTYLPTALREYPQAGRRPGRAQAMYDVGFAPGSEVLWPDHYAEYWDLTQRTYREAFDPAYDGATRPGRRSADRHAPGTRPPVTRTTTTRRARRRFTTPSARCR